MNTTHDSNVADFLLSDKAPDGIALRPLQAAYAYGELRRAAEQVARYILDISAEGDRILLIGENSFFWVASYLGMLKAGRVCVPLAAGLPRGELDYIFGITEARVAFLQARVASSNAASLGGVHVVTDRRAARAPEAASQRSFEEVQNGAALAGPPLRLQSPNALAALMFTSGSTGRPRGVMVSHANIIANTESIIEYLDLKSDDRMMAVLPFHYCFGASLLHTHLRVGASLVLDSRFMYPEAILQRMIEEGCTGFAGVPSHFQILLRSSNIRKKSLPCLRHVQQAGGHLAPSFLAELRDVLRGTRVFVMYGQTEATARLSYLDPGFCETKPGSVGKAIPGVRLRVLNERGDEVAPGEIGEVVAEGPNVALGYWRAAEDTATTFRCGKLYTGDLGKIDEDGFLYLVDRAKDFLKCGGVRISCRQIEEQLLAFEDLLEIAVIGVPDDVLGEAVKAFIVPRRPAPAGFQERFHRFCKERLQPQFVPRDIVVLAALPKNSAGKVLKPDLRDQRPAAYTTA